MNRIALERGFVLGRDVARDTAEIDAQELNAFVSSLEDDLIFLDGHMSHLLDVEVSIVLRCNPVKLRERLSSLGWREQKIAENVEAEAIDCILVESLEMDRKTFEIDTTEKRPEDVARDILDIIGGNATDFRAGSVDWSEVILSWY